MHIGFDLNLYMVYGCTGYLLGVLTILGLALIASRNNKRKG